MLKLTIVYDNTSLDPELKADWGFACVIQTRENTILFDTGGDGHILMHNLNRLQIDPNQVDTVFLSHPHFDHIGGLAAFLDVNDQVTVYAPDILRGIKKAKKSYYIKDAAELFAGVYTTGVLQNIEQSLVVQTDDGMVLIVGCSHPPMQEILAAASQWGPVVGIIGGLHGFDQFHLFQDMHLICATHCTRYKEAICCKFPAQWLEGGVGRVIEL